MNAIFTPSRCRSALAALLLILSGHSSILWAQLSVQTELPQSPLPTETAAALNWSTDYRLAMDQAKTEGKMLLLWFVDPTQSAANDAFEHALSSDAKIRGRLDDFLTAKLPHDTTLLEDGKPVKLLKHPAFAEMLETPGLAIIDQRDPDSPHFGRVVSVYPFTRGPIPLDRLHVLLNLPTGSLTQRTLVFAVRTHPLRPQSAWSGTSDLLAGETEKHAVHQASIRLQGHHRWEQRFHQINARLPTNLVANEVCAESWPGQNLVEAAEDCVDCWRQSPGHWDHVRRRHAMFGYDMKRGRNGIWYATGIFATPRE